MQAAFQGFHGIPKLSDSIATCENRRVYLRFCRRMAKIPYRLASLFLVLIVASCGGMGSGNMGGPTVEERKAAIAAEKKGDHYIGRRYYVKKTRFWGYLRQPGESWKNGKLVMFREDKKKAPDRYPEYGYGNQKFGFDQNYEYKIRGYYTGRKAYDPNSNQILPEFMLTGYDLINRKPGWLFQPNDRYDPYRITLFPR